MLYSFISSYKITTIINHFKGLFVYFPTILPIKSNYILKRLYQTGCKEDAM